MKKKIYKYANPIANLDVYILCDNQTNEQN